MMVCTLAWAALAGGAPPPPAPVDTVVARLQAAGAAERNAFAAMAVEALIEAYGEELERAGPPPRQDELQRWRDSAADYLAHLEALRRRIQHAAPVAVHLGPDGILQLRIERALLLLEGPRLASPSALQQRVLARFCAAYACVGEVTPHLGPRPGAAPSEAVWSFAQGRVGAVVTADGLEFPFLDLTAREAKGTLAHGLAEELRALARELPAGGVDRLAAGSGSDLRLIVPGAGDVIVAAPILRRAPWLWAEGLRWATARAQGRPAHAVLAGLERLLPPDEALALTQRSGLP